MRRRNGVMRRKIVWGTVVLLAITTATCFATGKQEGTQPGARTPAAKGSVTVTVYSFKREWEAGWKKLGQLYMEKNPQIKNIEFELVESAQYWDVMNAKLASNSLPDIVNLTPGIRVRMWAEHLADLTDLPLLAKLDKVMLESFRQNGRILGIPMQWEAHGMVYNMTHLAKVGYKKIPETRKEFIELNEKLKGAGLPMGILGWKDASILRTQNCWIPFRATGNADAHMQDLLAGKVDLVKSKEWNDYFDFLDMLVKYGNQNPASMDSTTERNAIYNEEYAWAGIEGTWLTPAIRKINPSLMQRIAIGPFPVYDDAVKNNIGIIIHGAEIFKAGTSKNPDEAKNFFSWLFGSDEAGKVFLDEIGAPLVRTDVKITNQNIGELGAQAKGYIDQGRYRQMITVYPMAITSDWAALLQKYIAGQISRTDALTKLQALFLGAKL
jgi:raffinose/stachyose/melibiose transport system substrate-binding protein